MKTKLLQLVSLLTESLLRGHHQALFDGLSFWVDSVEVVFFSEEINGALFYGADLTRDLETLFETMAKTPEQALIQFKEYLETTTDFDAIHPDEIGVSY